MSGDVPAPVVPSEAVAKAMLAHGQGTKYRPMLDALAAAAPFIVAANAEPLPEQWAEGFQSGVTAVWFVLTERLRALGVHTHVETPAEAAANTQTLAELRDALHHHEDPDQT